MVPKYHIENKYKYNRQVKARIVRLTIKSARNLNHFLKIIFKLYAKVTLNWKKFNCSTFHFEVYLATCSFNIELQYFIINVETRYIDR